MLDSFSGSKPTEPRTYPNRILSAGPDPRRLYQLKSHIVCFILCVQLWTSKIRFAQCMVGTECETHEHDNSSILCRPAPVLCGIRVIARPIRLRTSANFNGIVRCREMPAYVETPSERRYAQADNGILIYGQYFFVLQDFDGFRRSGGELHLRKWCPPYGHYNCTHIRPDKQRRFEKCPSSEMGLCLVVCQVAVTPELC